MRFVFVFAAIYILIAAVACQPLREAKAELELSKRFNRKPPDRFKKARPATSKVKRVSIAHIFSNATRSVSC